MAPYQRNSPFSNRGDTRLYFQPDQRHQQQSELDAGDDDGHRQHQKANQIIALLRELQRTRFDIGHLHPAIGGEAKEGGRQGQSIEEERRDPAGNHKPEGMLAHFP